MSEAEEILDERQAIFEDLGGSQYSNPTITAIHRLYKTLGLNPHLSGLFELTSVARVRIERLTDELLEANEQLEDMVDEYE